MSLAGILAVQTSSRIGAPPFTGRWRLLPPWPGGVATADAVVAAPGIGCFSVIPDWVPDSLPAARWSHTSVLVQFERLRDARVLIVGGRQSAFEWAALLAEAGAAAVHVVYRHDSPRFEASDWEFVEQLVDNTIRIPGWFRHLSSEEREAINLRFWAEGRLKLFHHFARA